MYLSIVMTITITTEHTRLSRSTDIGFRTRAMQGMAATFIQAMLIIFKQGSRIKLLKENCFNLVSAGSSLSNQSANKV